VKLLIGICEARDCGIALYDAYAGPADITYVTIKEKRYCIPCFLKSMMGGL
jgi:hypothetical protein